MCGIYGVLALRAGALPAEGALRRMAELSVHRGPDDEGAYVDQDLLLGVRRLSIIDVTGGHQPIANADGSLQVVYNGEIYNHRELGDQLVRAGHHFRTRSDTEAIVHLYEEHGDHFVERLNGMFAFALWDRRRRRLLIGRDRLGIKPLYYLRDGPRLMFASEAKAILAVSGASAQLDPVALQEYLTLGYTPAPFSIFKGIRKLPPAHLMVCEKGEVRLLRYWDLPNDVDRSMDEEEWAVAFLRTMDRAVAAQMVSDVPLGAFLSGGIDSSTIVGLMARQTSRPIKTYSIGFEKTVGADYYNELPWARRVAERFGTEHHEILVKPDAARLLPHLVWHLDEPIADAAFITTFLVAELARKDVGVILSGVGGDELFGGYRRYLGTYYDGYYRSLPRWVSANVMMPLAQALPSDRHSALMNLSRHLRTYLLSQVQTFEERYRAYVQVFSRRAVELLLCDYVPQPSDAFSAAFEAVTAADPLGRLSRVDILTQLPDDLLMLTDKMTMATSLECRVPFLDNTVLDLSLGMPSPLKIRGRKLKHIMKEALRDLLPSDVLFRKKRGFGAPFGAWLKADLAPLVREVLSRRSVQTRSLFNWEAVERTIALHEASREDHTDRLLALINLELWCRLYCDGRSPADVAEDLTIAEAS